MRPASDYIVFPLDLPSADEAKRFVRLLTGRVGMFKVGLELFISAGPEIVRFIREEAGARVFLDLKLHDIPATVSRAVDRIAGLGVSLATVHCGETPRMLEAAAAAAGDRVGILGVTLLTSVSGSDLAGAGFTDDLVGDPAALVARRAAAAHSAGCAGVVCSGLEAREIKTRFGPGFLAVTPGIRPAFDLSADDDQRRITTPAQAVRDGADYLVIGRPIRDAADPAAAAARIAGEIADGLADGKSS